MTDNRFILESIGELLATAPAKILAPTLFENFSINGADILYGDEVEFSDLRELPQWEALYEETFPGLWSPRPAMRARTREYLAVKWPLELSLYSSRIIAATIGDQLPDPLALAIWYHRYRGDGLAASAPFLLGYSEPQLMQDVISIIRRRQHEHALFGLAASRVAALVPDWLPMYRGLALLQREVSKVVEPPLNGLIHAFENLVADVDGSTRPKALAKYIQVSEWTHVWDAIALAEIPEQEDSCQLAWSPMPTSTPVESLSYQRFREERREIGAKGQIVLSKRGDDEMALSTNWWHSDETQLMVSGIPQRAFELLTSLTFPSAEVERVSHRITIISRTLIQREVILTLRPESGAIKPNSYVVLWQIPDSAGSATDFRVTGADGLPVEGPPEDVVVAIRETLTRVVDNHIPLHGSPEAQKLIPQSFYSRLERLSSQVWRIVARPTSRAEREIHFTWTERRTRPFRLRLLQLLRARSHFAVDVGGFSPSESLTLDVTCPPDLAVKRARLTVPQVSSTADLPQQYSGSTLALDLALSSVVYRYITWAPFVLGLLAVVIPFAIRQTSMRLDFLYILFAAAPAIFSITVEARRGGGSPRRWIFRSLRLAVAAAGLLVAGLLLLDLVPFDAEYEFFTFVLSAVCGFTLVCCSGIAGLLFYASRRKFKNLARDDPSTA